MYVASNLLRKCINYTAYAYIKYGVIEEILLGDISPPNVLIK